MIDVVTRYGLDTTGAVDNAPKLAAMGADIAALHRDRKPLPRLTFTEGVIATSAWPDLAYDRLQIVAEGECRIALMGNASVVFDASLRNPAADQPSVNGMLFSGFDIYAVSGSRLTPLVFRGIHRSKLQARVFNFSDTPGWPARPGIEMMFCIITVLDPQVITSRATNMTGVLVDAWPGKPNLQSTASTIINPCLEGCTVGLDLQSAGSCSVCDGTIENCGTGVHLGSASGHNMFYSVEMEGNGKDVVADSGAHDNGFSYCGNSGKLNTNFNWNLLNSNWFRN